MSDSLFCEHIEDFEKPMYPHGADCAECAPYAPAPPFMYESDAQWRRRLGLRPLFGPGSYDHYDYGAEEQSEPEVNACPECGTVLPEDSRATYCGGTCQKRAARRRARS
ncbi:hypothetical protein [Streptomyces sp. NPDC018833]|uniref:hypothetical protein n=1 Tax=Streptomyces sp. NPDC018833 TaxID=3365053 RepID=UPI0037AB1515